MTRASLLHILDHVGSISETEVRELEQLAAAFPYCQTAHVLLAKAAHDRGSMLASQHLRRAATYAADRQLLRQLLEQPAPALLPAETIPTADAVFEESSQQPAPSSTGFFEALVTEDVQPLEAETVEEESVAAASSVSAEPASLPDAIEPEPAPAAETAEPTEQPEPEAGTEYQGAPTTEVEAAEAPEPTTDAAPISAELEEDIAPEAPADEASEPDEVVVAAAIETEPTTAPEPTETVASAAAAPAPEPAETPANDDLLPAVAPPIRPPAEAGISRFEFGLSTPEEPSVPVLYQLPAFDDDEDSEDFDDEQLPLPTTRPAAPFHADNLLAYALLGGGSRYGYALQAQDAELTSALPQTEFFPPDALLLAHAAPAPASPLPSSLDLINRFLKNQPRLKSPVVPPVAAEEQADLSVRSTSIAPALASESLARIMVRQGKIDKAIEIYERLMVRQPEKRAYFADQIQQLQTPR